MQGWWVAGLSWLPGLLLLQSKNCQFGLESTQNWSKGGSKGPTLSKMRSKITKNGSKGGSKCPSNPNHTSPNRGSLNGSGPQLTKTCCLIVCPYQMDFGDCCWYVLTTSQVTMSVLACWCNPQRLKTGQRQSYGQTKSSWTGNGPSFGINSRGSLSWLKERKSRLKSWNRLLVVPHCKAEYLNLFSFCKSSHIGYFTNIFLSSYWYGQLCVCFLKISSPHCRQGQTRYV